MNLKNIITGLLTVIAVVLLVEVKINDKPAQSLPSHPSKSYLGRFYDDPDNWQAQAQKKEGVLPCPPFCFQQVVTVQQKGRWHAD
jgi:hypothetical protein